ncbi:acyltransferase [Harryflintia acetispora]|uniref:acyltransferase n=1 Tax=Harryflintia acetispora TaxID=1849041 RepID=UPI003307B468
MQGKYVLPEEKSMPEKKPRSTAPRTKIHKLVFLWETIVSIFLLIGAFQFPFSLERKALLCLFGVAFLAGAVGELWARPIPRPPKRRLLWVDFLKAMCAFFIVVIHGISAALSGEPAARPDWMGYLFLNAATRCAVPIFIMVTGGLMLGKDISIKEAVSRAIKAAILLVSWGLIYILAKYYIMGTNQEDILTQILKLPVQRGPSGYLWYSYLIVWVFLFLPVLQKLYRVLNKKERLYFIGLTLLLPGILDFYGKVMGFKTSGLLMQPFSLYMTPAYMGMLFIGKMIFENQEFIQNKKGFSLAVTASGLGLTMILTYQSSLGAGKLSDLYLSETNIFVLTYSVGVLALVCAMQHSLERIPERVRSGIERISRLSLGIYFFHVLVIWTMGDISIGRLCLDRQQSPVSALLLCVIYYGFSVLGMHLFSKVPFLRKFIM